jgi:hypothetical protein
MAQEAGADVLTHVPADKAFEKTDIDRMLADKRIIVPTLTVMEAFVKVAMRPGLDYSFARETVAALYHASVPIIARIDAN